MNLLDSVLCTCNAQKYTNVFKHHGIDVFTLKLLSDSDLQLLGITEEELRATILQHVANLQIPAEKHIDIIVNEKYIQSVLAQMSVHLTKNLAALSIAANRENVVLCDLRLTMATRCLKSCVRSLSQQLHEFEEKMLVKRKRRRNYKKMVTPVVLLACLAVISFKFVSYLHK